MYLTWNLSSFSMSLKMRELLNCPPLRKRNSHVCVFLFVWYKNLQNPFSSQPREIRLIMGSADFLADFS